MMIATVQRPDDNNMDETKTTWAEMCQDMTETTCEHRNLRKYGTNVKICLRVTDQKVPSGHPSDSEQTMTESGLAVEGNWGLEM